MLAARPQDRARREREALVESRAAVATLRALLESAEGLVAALERLSSENSPNPLPLRRALDQLASEGDAARKALDAAAEAGDRALDALGAATRHVRATQAAESERAATPTRRPAPAPPARRSRERATPGG